MINYGEVVILRQNGVPGRWKSRSGKSIWDKVGYAKLALRSHWEYERISRDGKFSKKYPTFESFQKDFDIAVFQLNME